MRVVISMLLASLFLFAFNPFKYPREKVVIDSRYFSKLEKQLSALNENQKWVLESVYRKCLKYDLGNTCVAIAWQESYFGTYKVVPWTGDYGVMGINLYWFFMDNGLNYKNPYLRSKWATKLVEDDDYTVMYAVAKLLKLKQKYKSWIEVWAHYNGGSRPNYWYAKQILNKIYIFRKIILKEVK